MRKVKYSYGVGTLELKVPRTRAGHFSHTVFERYQRNEKAVSYTHLTLLTKLL
ncbi:hypothetical protein B6175_03735 [Staphylococcus aureus]|nr:hypothetical protein B6175_03735 [Staphylococcus aureus]